MPDPTLSPTQERSIAHATARLNIWEGSVRAGKTVASLLRWLMYVANAPRGGHLLIAGKTLDTVYRNVFGPLTDPAITGPAARLIRYTRGASTGNILGRPVEVVTANDARGEGRLRGMTCAGAYCDELTLLPEAFFAQLLARLSVPGAQLFATTNPDGPMHWLRQKFLLRAGELRLRRFRFTLDDNPYLDPAYVTALKAEYVGLWYRRYILGEWCLAEGAVYDMWDPDVHVIDVLPPIHRWIGLGIDYGTVNPFAALLLGLGANRRLYLAREWRWDSKRQRRQLTDGEYSTRLRAWLDDIPVPGTDLRGARPEWTVVDPSAASFVTQLHRDGLTPMLADNSVLDGLRTVGSVLAYERDPDDPDRIVRPPQLQVHRSCTGLIDEIPGYSWDEDKVAKGEDAPIKVDDHSLDAGRYVLHTTQAAWRPQIGRHLTLAA